jgi:hypothetical protein
MFKPLARGIDWLLSMTLARFVRPPAELPAAPAVADDPSEVQWPESAEVAFRPADAKLVKAEHPQSEEPLFEFTFASPGPLCWPENQEVAGGVAVGPEAAKNALILLPGAYEDQFTRGIRMARPFVAQGCRAFITAPPCHMQRKVPDAFSGAPFFWSTEHTVAGLHQWLAEVRALMGYLRRNGFEQIGLFGYSLGSLAAGLAASLWNDVAFLAMLSPVSSHAQAITHSNIARRIWPWMANLSAEQTALLDRWAPLHRKPLVPKQAFFITRYDYLQPTALQEEWWESWGKPSRWDYWHGHLSVHHCKDFYRDLGTFAVGTCYPGFRFRCRVMILHRERIDLLVVEGPGMARADPDGYTGHQVINIPREALPVACCGVNTEVWVEFDEKGWVRLFRSEDDAVPVGEYQTH